MIPKHLESNVAGKPSLDAQYSAGHKGLPISNSHGAQSDPQKSHCFPANGNQCSSQGTPPPLLMILR